MQDDVAECIKKDYVAVVGTAQDFGFFYSLGAHPRQVGRAALNNVLGVLGYSGSAQMGQHHPDLAQQGMAESVETMERNTDFANKMMFAAQGIRGLRLNSGGADYKTLIYFTTGYNAAQLAAIRTAGATHASPNRTFAITSTAALIAKLNETRFPDETCARRILRIDFYTHGLPGDLAFGYQGALQTTQAFLAVHARRLDRTLYDMHGIPGSIYSWGCQTAQGGARGGPLSQVIADATGATVYAYARRTDYANTWNTGSQTAQQAGLAEIAGDGSRVLWHPDGARGGVREGTTPESNTPGRLRFVPAQSTGVRL